MTPALQTLKQKIETLEKAYEAKLFKIKEEKLLSQIEKYAIDRGLSLFSTKNQKPEVGNTSPRQTFKK